MGTKAKTASRQKRRPDLETFYTVNEDGSRNFLQPADVKGFWQVRRNLVNLALVLIYLVLPWIQIDGRPLIHFDLPGRTAFLLGMTFTNQDFYLAYYLIAGFGIFLFILTSVLGRIWCGFLCPQTVFMEGIFRRIERWLEGPRLTRLRRNLGPPTFDKVWRKTVKHAFFLLLAGVIAHTFLSYFLPVRELLESLRQNPREHMSAFLWTWFWVGIMYFNYAWFREQTCLIVCPYGRLQSTLIDFDTVIIGYDETRGEPRHRGAGEGGDCVDCFRCVEVCPTGIDIRNGLQLECIGCTNCIDACDAIMDRIGKPRGLVRYDSQRSFTTGERRFWRPRVFLYAALVVVGFALFTWKASSRQSFHANSVRPAGMPFVFDQEQIRNLYTLHIQNKTVEPQVYLIGHDMADKPQLEFIMPQTRVPLEGLADAEVPMFAILPRGAYTTPFPFNFVVTDSTSGVQREVEVRFRGP